MVITPRRTPVSRGVFCVGSSTVERLVPRNEEVGGSTPPPRSISRDPSVQPCAVHRPECESRVEVEGEGSGGSDSTSVTTEGGFGRTERFNSSMRGQGAKCQRTHTRCNEPRREGSSPSVPAKLYIVGRRDLPPGLRAAQMFHAGRQFQEDHLETERRWFRESNTIVLLEVPDEEALQELASRAKASHVSLTEFSEEPDLGFTALALGPDAQRLVSSLPLALKPS